MHNPHLDLTWEWTERKRLFLFTIGMEYKPPPYLYRGSFLGYMSSDLSQRMHCIGLELRWAVSGHLAGQAELSDYLGRNRQAHHPNRYQFQGRHYLQVGIGIAERKPFLFPGG